MLQRPNESEYPAYYQPYIQLVPEGNLLQVLKDELQKTITLFEGISEEDSYFRYDEKKWSIKEVLCHMADTERIMSYRLLRVGRGDETPLAGFNENDYVNGSQIERLPLKNILEDFLATRNATISLIQNMPETAWENKGFANDTPITTRAIAYIIAGHAIHHKKLITERYL
ncbi:damage-inducible protein DinB [Bacillus sp. MUM 116]|uniref:DinB family protein n=1 Tax=Bacillus sp. MUM 116 TaxID=1678002 RepID=UPI0008F5F80C|nr:DinB family protein [Bacillus sp. MUM 116]OIK16261.1 damage-inducible protein DinB [Bacillus sp. MUM 116]